MTNEIKKKKLNKAFNFSCPHSISFGVASISTVLINCNQSQFYSEDESISHDN